MKAMQKTLFRPTFRSTYLLLVVALLFTGLSGCSEGSIDRALGSEETVDNSIKTDDVAGESIENNVSMKPRWQPVVQLKGSSDKRTKRFGVNSPEWRISWQTEPGAQNDEFFIFLYEKEGDDPLIIATSPENDMAEMEGQGEFFLEVRASQPYKVDIKEYR